MLPPTLIIPLNLTNLYFVAIDVFSIKSYFYTILYLPNLMIDCPNTNLMKTEKRKTNNENRGET